MKMAMCLGTVDLFATRCANAKATRLHNLGAHFPSPSLFPNIPVRLNCLFIRVWRCPDTVFTTSSVGRRSLCVACLPSSTSQDGPPPPSPPPKPFSTKKLYVGRLSYITTEDRLRKYFSRFGELVEVKIMMDRVAKRSKGFGFIEYKTEEEAEAAIKGMDVKFLDGRVIFVEFAKAKTQNKQPSPPGTREPPPFS